MIIRRRELLLWCALAAALLTVNVVRLGSGRLMNDSYQYLSAAENINLGNGLSTSIVTFDIERMSRRVPAPLTTFPPGYSIVIAELNHIGLDRERAGLLCSMVAFLALFPLMAWGARVLELTANITRLVFVWLLANSWVAEYPVQIVTESTFAAVTTAAVIALMAAERGDGTAGRRWATLALGSVLVGLSYWVRYAGLFLFAAVFTYYALNATVRKDRRSLKELAFSLLPLSIIGVGFVRNILLTSSWQGGNTKKVFHPILLTLKGFIASIYHLLLGEKVVSRLGVLEVLFVSSALALVVLAIHSFQTRSRRAELEREAPYRAPLVLLFSYLAIYSLGMIYLGVVSVISFGTRMFYPLLPLLLLGLGHLLARVERELHRTSTERYVLVGATALLTASYVAINARSVSAEQGLMPHQLTAARMALPTPSGEPLRAWIDANMPADAIVVATDAQSTGYVLKRRAVALTEAEYTEEVWSASKVDALMASYRAGFLILYPTATPATVAAQEESPFLSGLLKGSLPPWLRLATENQDVKIFRRVDPLEVVLRDEPSAVRATGELP